MHLCRVLIQQEGIQMLLSYFLTNFEKMAEMPLYLIISPLNKNCCTTYFRQENIYSNYTITANLL